MQLLLSFFAVPSQDVHGSSEAILTEVPVQLDTVEEAAALVHLIVGKDFVEPRLVRSNLWDVKLWVS